MTALSDSGHGGRISITRSHGTRIATPVSTNEESEYLRSRSSQTERERGYRRPRGTGDDPFTLGVDDDDDDDDE